MRRLLFLQLCIVIILVFSSCGTDAGAPNPQINGLQPDSGPPGTMVTIEGQGFSPEASNISVTFGGTSAPVNSASQSSIETMVPDGLDSGSAQVKVTVGNQTATGPSFMVEQAAPGISSVEPDSGTVGTEVTIAGMNFSATASEITIEFNGTRAPVNGAAKDQLLTEVPQGATDGPIKVTVKQKSTTGPDFDVITDGTIEVVTSTSGDDQDSDGYTITVDGSSSKSVGINDTKYFANLEQGSHDAQISGLAHNCSISGSNPRSISISAGDTTSTTFDVSCQAVAHRQVVFESDRSGNDEIYVMNIDGSNPTKLTDNTSADILPKISHDGTKVAFASDRSGNFELYMMNADGSNVQQVTNSSGASYSAVWAPDDSKIAFTSDRSGNFEVYTINTDGSNLTRLTNHSGVDQASDWSPDGDRIALDSGRDGDQEIYTINTDGTGLKQLTYNSENDFRARWSPDASKIAFVSAREGNNNLEIYTINADGSGPLRITNTPGFEDSPSWSPNGSELIFSTDRDGNDEIYKVNADGSGTLINMTANSASDDSPHWSPVK